MKPGAEDIGKRIKELRRSEHLTQAEFGERIGVKGNTVAGYEKGRRNPSESVINFICSVFGVRQTWLRTGEGEMYLSDSDPLDILTKLSLEFNCNELEMKLLAAYLRLKEKERDVFCGVLIKMFPQAVSAAADENPLERTWVGLQGYDTVRGHGDS